MLNRILVPTDFSPAADAALNDARRVAHKFGASLHVLHVMDDPVTTMMMSIESHVPDLPEVREAMRREARRLMEARLSAEDRTKLHVTCAGLFVWGAGTIVDYAADHGIDLIVMGTHGRTGMSHLLMGSVAERVIRTAPCAVMTVPDPSRAKTNSNALDTPDTKRSYGSDPSDETGVDGHDAHANRRRR